MHEKETIAIVLPDLRSGGAERVNLDLARGFRERGHPVIFVLRRLRGELISEARQLGEIHELGAKRVRDAVGPLTAFMRKNKPGAVLASMWPLTAVAVRARAKSGHHCPVVVAEHGILSRQYATWGMLHGLLLRRSLTYTARRADAVTCVSKGVADDLAKLTGQDRNHFEVIYNPVPVAPAPSPAELATAEALWAGGKGKRIITVGRLKPVKNHELMISAFAKLNDPDARLMIVGDGDLQEPLARHAQDCGVGETVIFAGFQPKPAAFYATADLFALSSRNEGFGNVIVEAMGQGLSVVSTDCPTGPREILNHGEYGILTPVGDPDQLADAMRELIANPADPDKQKQRASAFVPEVAVDEYLRLLLPKQG